MEVEQRHHKAGLVPRQLPGAPRLFTGRTRELAQLTGVLETGVEHGATVVISAIGGAGGIGKTALALHWAHENVARFPDGQLYVNLRGFDSAGSPMPPPVAVRGFLDALGVESRAIPADVDAQVALYRSLVAGRRMLVMLDNARDTAHVASLLPGSSACTVLVTSRQQLAGLVAAHGARPLALDVLTETEARELLCCHLGVDRIAAEPEAAAELRGYCAGLPLALRIVAARAAAHPAFPLAVLAEELRETTARLDAFDGGELSVNMRAVFSWSYQALDADMARVFGLMGLASGPDISLPAITSLIAEPITRTRALLRDLEAAHLVSQHAPGRYRMHDLVRLYVAEQAHHDQSQDSRNAALLRLVDFYLHTAYTGERLLSSGRPVVIELGQLASACVPQRLEDQAVAMEWFDTEHLCILAAQKLAVEQGWNTHVWQLAWVLHTFHGRRGDPYDHIATWRAGVIAAQRLDDPPTQVRAHRRLGRACARAGMHAEALDHLRQALVLAEQTKDVLGQAHTQRALAWAWEQQGDDQRALTHATHALRLFRILDHPVYEAQALNTLGWYHARLGHHDQAHASCEQALALHRRHHDRVGEADTLYSLGYVAHHTAHHTQAINYYGQALTLFRHIGHTYQEVDTLAHLGEIHAALGQHGDARDAWQQALDLYQAQHRTIEAELMQQQIAGLDDQLSAAGEDDDLGRGSRHRR